MPSAVRADRSWSSPSLAIRVASSYSAAVRAVASRARAARWHSAARVSARPADSSAPAQARVSGGTRPPPSRISQWLASASASSPARTGGRRTRAARRWATTPATAAAISSTDSVIMNSVDPMASFPPSPRRHMPAYSP
ncbi:hypothetical protein ABT090_04120 [Streptomyces asoensis]|uniref:hypothetical protein n=1 Tax=Streptomyces asoensis TaxID=249586 RepID=UPI003325D067